MVPIRRGPGGRKSSGVTSNTIETPNFLPLSRVEGPQLLPIRKSQLSVPEPHARASPLPAPPSLAPWPRTQTRRAFPLALLLNTAALRSPRRPPHPLQGFPGRCPFSWYFRLPLNSPHSIEVHHHRQCRKRAVDRKGARWFRLPSSHAPSLPAERGTATSPSAGSRPRGSDRRGPASLVQAWLDRGPSERGAQGRDTNSVSSTWIGFQQRIALSALHRKGQSPGGAPGGWHGFGPAPLSRSQCPRWPVHHMTSSLKVPPSPEKVRTSYSTHTPPTIFLHAHRYDHAASCYSDRNAGVRKHRRTPSS